MISFADKLNFLFATVRNPRTGQEYTNEEVSRALKREVSAAHIGQMRAGARTNPTMATIVALANFFGVPPAFFLAGSVPEEDSLLAKRVNELFATGTHPEGGREYTNEEVAAATGGEVTAQELEALRKGETRSLTRQQAVALARFFRVHPTYFSETGPPEVPLSETLHEVLSNPEMQKVMFYMTGMSKEARQYVVRLVEEAVAFARAQEASAPEVRQEG